jgi:hypothetical protein
MLNHISPTPLHRIANDTFSRLYSENQMELSGGSFWELHAKSMISALTHIWHDMSFSKPDKLPSVSDLLERSSIQDIVFAMKSKRLSEESKLAVEVYLVSIGVTLDSAQKLTESSVVDINLKAQEQHTFNRANLHRAVNS